MSEPVIIGCGSEYGIECGACGWTGALSMGHKCSGYHPGSLVALKVALADAVDAVRANMAVMQRRVSAGEDCSVSVDREYLDALQREFGLEDAEESALDALRAHPDYTEPTNG